ncbi:MAG: hypothetical protein QOI11_2465, partial [Candidatus Eremiobacteraeota bacterium]|nr:hypothetical protein [Candidatus Eremiobacteraeota bacterium]
MWSARVAAMTELAAAPKPRSLGRTMLNKVPEVTL